jgi:hypothetical protein
MLSLNTKAVSHFGKFVPCCEARVISYSDDRARLVRVETRAEAEQIAKSVTDELYKTGSLQGDYLFGDNYMLSQHPVTAPSC